MYARNLRARPEAALTDAPVVFLNGARRTGKTTLARQMAAGRSAAVDLTLGGATVLAAAAHDPEGFVRPLSGTTSIAEVQRAPALISRVKALDW